MNDQTKKPAAPMTLRDRFAEAVLPTLVAADLHAIARLGEKSVATSAYAIADAMLEVRNAPRVEPAPSAEESKG